MVLLHSLNLLKSKWNVKIVAAHLNHRTRGEESEKDRRFVERWAKRWRVPCVVADLETHTGKSSASWENFWREERMKFFQAAAGNYKTDTIAFGHNMNDQAETVMLRILRGTGPGGLGAMRHISRRAGMRIVRPLLDVSRDEITAYAKQNGVHYVEDSSNSLPVFMRNRIRHDLIPFLETNYQPKIQVLLAHLASVSGEEDELLESLAAEAFRRVRVEEFSDVISLDVQKLLKKNPVIRYRIIRKAAEKLSGLRQIDYSHAGAIQTIIESNKDAAITLPKGVQVRKERNLILISVDAYFIAAGHSSARTKSYAELMAEPIQRAKDDPLL